MPVVAARSVGVVLVLAGTAAMVQCGGSASPAASVGSPYKPVASVDQVMDGIVIPASQAVFDAVVYSNGELVQSPTSDDDWNTLRIQALALAEAGNLLMMPPRAKDNDDWITLSQALTEGAAVAANAAESKNVDQLLNAGGEIYRACTSCHEKYLPMDGEQ